MFTAELEFISLPIPIPYLSRLTSRAASTLQLAISALLWAHRLLNSHVRATASCPPSNHALKVLREIQDPTSRLQSLPVDVALSPSFIVLDLIPAVIEIFSRLAHR